MTNAVHLPLSKFHSIHDLSTALNTFQQEFDNDSLRFFVDFDSNSISSEVIVFLTAFIKRLKVLGHHPELECSYSAGSVNAVKQAICLGFFRHLDITPPIADERLHCTCQLTEMDEFYEPYTAHLAVRHVLDNLAAMRIDDQSLSLLQPCLEDLMNNVAPYSAGIVASQYFPFQGELKLIICSLGTHSAGTETYLDRLSDLCGTTMAELSLKTGEHLWHIHGEQVSNTSSEDDLCAYATIRLNVNRLSLLTNSNVRHLKAQLVAL